MSKKILLVTGAGASKSLTASLPKNQKVGLIGGGGFRELPTGAELLQNIIKYQDKSLIFLFSKLMFTFVGINESNNDFFYFANNVEYVNEKLKQAKEHAAQTYYDFSVPNGYENSIKESVLEIKRRTKDWAEEQKKLIQAGSTTYYGIGFDSQKKLAQLIESSSFIERLIADLLNEDSTNVFTFNNSFSDHLFVKFIYNAIASNNKIFNNVKPVFNHKILVDLFFRDLFNRFQEVIRSVSGLLSYENLSIFDNSRRFNGDTVVGNSIYKARQDAFNDMLEKINNLLIVKEYSKEDLINTINDFIIHLNEFIVKLEHVILLPPLDKPTFMHGAIDLGQNRYANEFNGLFGVEIKNESKHEHNINSSIVKSVIDFRTAIEKILVRINTSNNLEELLTIYNELINLLRSNGFNLEQSHRGNGFIQQAHALRDEVLAYLYATIIDNKKINSELETQINQMRQCYIASSVVRHYQPFSIDYFMMNIKQVASYEFSDIVNDEIEINARINNLHQYTKLIIADILMGHVSYAYKARDDNNYLRHMIWKFLEAAHFTDKSLDEYILSSVEVINFNYELSFLMMLYDFLPSSVVNEFASKEHGMTHVYGNIYLEDTSKNPKQVIYMCGEHAIWNSLFKIEVGKGNKISTGNFPNQKEIYCNNLLKQISENIKWIGENKNEENSSREKFQNSFAKANEIYILGFGFDVNNLYNLGLINKAYKLEDNICADDQAKTIYISGGNAKIISTLKNIFSIVEQDVVDNVYHLKNPSLKLNIYVSKKHLPEALETDL